EVLDPLDHAGGVELEAALDEDLLHERVAYLDAGPLGGHPVLEGLRREDGGAADAVAPGPGTEEDDLVPGAGGIGEVNVLVAEHAEAERVDQRVALVGGVELGLAADVGQTQAVAVAADAGDDAVHDARGVRVVDGTEAELVHDGDRPGIHGDDVADDAAHAGRGALIRLDEARVVVRLDLEGHGPSLTDVDDAGVLPDPDQEMPAHLVGGLVAELAQMAFGGLVGAVLGPHHRVHGELGRGGPAPEDFDDAGVLVGL